MPASPQASRLTLGPPHPVLEESLASWLGALSATAGATVVTPHRRLAEHLPRRLGELGVATVGLVTVTLDRLAEQLALPELQRSGSRVVDVRHFGLLVSELGVGLEALPASRRDPLTAGAFAELRELLVPPDALLSAAGSCPELPHLGQLAECYRRFCAALAERRLADPAALAEIAARRDIAADGRRAVALYGFAAVSPRQELLLRTVVADPASRLFLPDCGAQPSRVLPSGEILARRLGLPPPRRQRRTPAAAGPTVRVRVWNDPWQETVESLRALLAAGPDAVVVLAASSPGRKRWSSLLGELSQRPPPLAGSAAARALLALLRLAVQSPSGRLPRRDLEELLHSGALAAGDRCWRWPQLLRRLGIVERRDGYERLASGEVPRPGLSAALRAELRPLGTFLAVLLAALEELSAPATSWAQVGRRLQRVARAQLRPTAERRRLHARLADLADFEGILPPPRHAPLAAVEALLAVPEPASPLPGWELEAGVTASRVLWPELLQGLRFRPEWLCDLFSEADRASLDGAFSALGLPHRLPRREDLAALHETLVGLAQQAARDELLLSRPQRDGSGRPVAPAPAWNRLAGVAGEADDGLVASRLSRGWARPRPALLPHERDLVRLREEPEADRWLERRFPHLRRAGRAERAWRTPRLTAWDGDVGGRLGGAALDRWRRPDGALRLTASSLQSYSHCPFQFFLGHVLGLERNEPKELGLGPGRAELGVRVHDFLAELFGELDRRGALPLAAESLAAARALAEELLARRQAEEAAGLREELPELRAARYRRLLEATGHLLLAEAEGPPRQLLGTEVDLESAGPGAVLESPRGPVVFAGRIDRLDRDAAGLLVVDYKTGRLPAERYAPRGEPGAGRQLAVYARALGHAGEPVRGLYQGIGLASGLASWEWSPEQLGAARHELEERLVELVDGVTAGFFPQVEHDRYCDHRCPFGEVCGPARRRVVALKSMDPRHPAARRRNDDRAG